MSVVSRLLNAAPNLLAPLVRALVSADYSSLMEPLDASRVYSFLDVPYAATSRHPKHHLDVFMASEPFPRPLQPVLLYLHGGGWVHGDRLLARPSKQEPSSSRPVTATRPVPSTSGPSISHVPHAPPKATPPSSSKARPSTATLLPGMLYHNVGIAAVRAGMVGVLPSYRLSPEASVSDMLADVAAALAWTRANARRYGGDPGRIYLAGHSAGAHLATLALASGTCDVPAGGGSSNQTKPGIAGLFAMSAVLNIDRLGLSPFGPALVTPVFGEARHGWRAASPVHLPGAAARLARTPSLFVYAEDDFHLPSDAEELELAVAQAAGGSGGGGVGALAPRLAAALAASAPSSSTSTSSPVHDIRLSPSSTPSLARASVTKHNHMSIVAAMGREGDAVTRLLGAFVDATSGRDARA